MLWNKYRMINPLDPSIILAEFEGQFARLEAKSSAVSFFPESPTGVLIYALNEFGKVVDLFTLTPEDEVLMGNIDQ